MKIRSTTSACALCCLFVWGTAHAGRMQASAPPPANVPAPDDRAKIDALLANYVNSVSTGDRGLFESQLLDVHIPFAGIGTGASSVNSPDLQGIQDYQGFRKAIFDNGDKFQQRFSHVQIEQVGNLAQVSLDYETAIQGTEYTGKGWKVLQLIKVQGQWKIASEFFTGYPKQSPPGAR